MHPTPSIIIFTVSSGAGLGLLMLLVLLQGFGLGDPLGLETRLAAAGLGLGLVVTGLVASLFHLANPKNAWKAFNRFRTSWLSREGVFSLLLFPAVAAYLGAVWTAGGSGGAGVRVLAGLVLLLALATLFSTGMIYASLKPIRQWRNPLVPPMYIVLGLASGGVLLTALEAFAGGPTRTAAAATLVLIGLAALVKSAYYCWIGRPAGPTINTATGMTRAQVKLLDMGHSHATFLTREFGNFLHRTGSRTWRAIVFVVGFLVPGIAVIALMRGQSPAYGVLAVLAMLAGMVVERWLFFVEARHAVTLYHGRQRT